MSAAFESSSRGTAQSQSQSQLPPPPSSTAAGMTEDAQRIPPHFDPQEAVCPVAHAVDQPLPPGHPPVQRLASNLKLPGGARCVFYRSPEDYTNTPPLSRSSSTALFLGSSTPQTPTTPQHSQQQHQKAGSGAFDSPSSSTVLQAQANINPLPEGAGLTLDPSHSLVLASRNSQLALVQCSHISTMLDAHYGANSPAFLTEAESAHLPPDLVPLPRHAKAVCKRVGTLGIEKPCYFPITSMSTAGDHNQRSPLYVIGGEGRAIWTKELEVALQEGAIDAIVHCLKDIPTTLPEGLELAAICEREDPRDALVVKKGLPFSTLDELPPGSVIGTSSVRRVAQLRRRYPQLVFSDVRGNINTRLNKLDSSTGPYTALVLAAAGLIRLNLSHRITAFLTSPVLYYSVGQGSLAIEVRSPPAHDADPRTNRDARIKAMIASIGCWRSTFRGEAERALLRELEGGCSVPVGVETRFEDHEQIEGGRKELLGVPVVLKSAETGEEKAIEGHFRPVRHDGDDGPQSNGVTAALTNGASAGSGAKPALERLATEQSGSGIGGHTPIPAIESTETEAERKARLDALDAAIAAAANPTADENPPYVSPVAAEDRSVCPSALPAGSKEAVPRLHLQAIVVSLDGSRSVSHADSAVCTTVEEARALGQRVARSLIEGNVSGGDGAAAAEILEEVERHRKWAEMADEARRKARLEGKSEAEAMAIAAASVRARAAAHAKSSASSSSSASAATKGGAELREDPIPEEAEAAERREEEGGDEREHGGATVVPGLGPYALEEIEKRRKLEETLSRAKKAGVAIVNGVGSQVPGSGSAGVQVEVDRRFVPRDDGQPKAWEV
ncbi:porphobilinogen deaminase [Tilletia horrida]|nr:porphobilinogen deaminase [Tilletia horrida]